MRLALALPAALLAATLASAQTPPTAADHLRDYALPVSTAFDGKWAGDWTHGPTPEETDHLLLSLATDASGHVSGVVNVDKTFDVPLEWGLTLRDQAVVFQIMFPTEHGPIPMVFIGQRSGTAINFGISFISAGLPPALKNVMATPVLKFDATKQP